MGAYSDVLNVLVEYSVAFIDLEKTYVADALWRIFGSPSQAFPLYSIRFATEDWDTLGEEFSDNVTRYVNVVRLLRPQLNRNQTQKLPTTIISTKTPKTNELQL